MTMRRGAVRSRCRGQMNASGWSAGRAGAATASKEVFNRKFRKAINARHANGSVRLECIGSHAGGSARCSLSGYFSRVAFLHLR